MPATGEKLTNDLKARINSLRQQDTASAREIAEVLGLTPRAVEKQIAALKVAGRLERVGPPRGGHWEVLSE